MPFYDVKLHFSAFHSVENIEAESEQEALAKAKAMPINYQAIMDSLESWDEADTIDMAVERKEVPDATV